MVVAAMLLLAGCTSGTFPTPQPPNGKVVVTGGPTARLSGTIQFGVTVTGLANSTVTWDVNGVAGGSAATGTISTTGLYTAPAVLPAAPYTVTVSAVSVLAPSPSGTATVAIENPTAVAVSGSAAEVGVTSSYAVTVNGSGFVPTSILQVGGANEATTYLSATQLQTTVVVPTGTTSLQVGAVNPDPGGTATDVLTIGLPTSISLTAAARLLDQTSFGPTAASIQHVAQIGVNNYLVEQFATPPTLMPTYGNPLPSLCLAYNTAYPCDQSYFFQNVLRGADQLRQRVAFAESEMFVVSTQSVEGFEIPSFENNLLSDAFGNFYDVMHDVTLSSAMGDYLNMLNSAAPPAGQIANENFGREMMQLFTLGLYTLNPDGTPQLDSSNNTIPTYTEAQVEAFSRAYTGWTYGTATGTPPTRFPNGAYYPAPMGAFEAQHDETSKTLLNGFVSPAGQTAEQDLSDALHNIFNHPNVGPFVCKQLIQHLVTSTPSPAYVGRVAAVFANDGTGVRGNMKAVITAILTDAEARAGDTNPDYDGGHLREPILFLTDVYRALEITNNDTVDNQFYTLQHVYLAPLGEDVYNANSVFNFFPPDYVIPETTVNAPEFGIENTATVTAELSLTDTILNNKLPGYTLTFPEMNPLTQMAANPATLTSYLSMLFMHSQMPQQMQTVIENTIAPLTNMQQRVRIAAYLVLTSPQYKIIH